MILRQSNFMLKLSKIFQKEFNQVPQKIIRQKTGICNEVYFVKLKDKEVVIRMNKESSDLKGLSLNIPLFKERGIVVPEILAEDYSKKLTDYNYQILTKIKGQDIEQVFFDLDREQLLQIAHEVSQVFKKIGTLSTNGKFGDVVAGIEPSKLSWAKCISENISTIKQRNEKTEVVKQKFIEILDSVFKKYKSYFDSVESQTYCDDICSKNVIIYKGKFNGLVDLDSIVYGDFLEAIGRIKASWFGTENGKIYLDAIMSEMELNNTQKEMVSIYSILNRIYWLSEIGIQFNQNTSDKIGAGEVQRWGNSVDALLGEIEL